VNIHRTLSDIKNNNIIAAMRNEAARHLHRGLVYIDLNMVRARVVTHPSDWTHSGYREIQNPPRRYRIIDLRELSSLSGFAGVTDFQQAHRRRHSVARPGSCSSAKILTGTSVPFDLPANGRHGNKINSWRVLNKERFRCPKALTV